MWGESQARLEQRPRVTSMNTKEVPSRNLTMTENDHLCWFGKTDFANRVLPVHHERPHVLPHARHRGGVKGRGAGRHAQVRRGRFAWQQGRYRRRGAKRLCFGGDLGPVCRSLALSVWRWPFLGLQSPGPGLPPKSPSPSVPTFTDPKRLSARWGSGTSSRPVVPTGGASSRGVGLSTAIEVLRLLTRIPAEHRLYQSARVHD